MRKRALLFGAFILGLCSLAGHAATTNNLSMGATGWRFLVGNAEASSPVSAWRTNGFNDSSWQTGGAPIGYGEAGIASTVPDARTQPTPSYLCVFTRHTFNIPNPSAIADLTLTVQIDDGYVAWINGAEVLRNNMPAGEPLFTTAAINAIEPNASSTTISSGLGSLLVAGTNVLAIQMFNANTNSSDLLMDASIVTTVDDTPPVIVNRIPAPGQTVQTLFSAEIVFSEPVQGVDASDLLINGVPATNVIFGVPGQFVFEFPAPPTGSVFFSFTNMHGIQDLATPPNPFTAVSWSCILDPNSNPGTFRINEFMADNENGIRDENGDTSDWIELFNPSVTANLQGWSLTDDPLDLRKWIFPYHVLNANNYLYVWASGKDRTNISGSLKMHTSFALGSGAGYLALVDPNTNIVSVFNPYPDQTADISYGRDLAVPEITGFYSTPTPGTANLALGDGIAPEVTFSHSSRAFPTNAPFQLALSTPGVGNAAIFYALGTNVPGSNTFQYTTPLNITTTTVLRARSFVPGKLPGPIKTVSFIALSTVNAGTLPGANNVVTFNSGLPIMILHNYGQGVVPANREAQHHVLFQVFDNDCGRASMTNLPNLTGRGIFHSRGSSTLVASSGKAQFFFEARDESGADKAVPLFGLPEESDWVLYAPNNFEPGIIHNPLAHAWYRDLGRYGSRTRFFELYLQDDTNPGGAIVPGDYHGIYVLEEKIKRDANRVDIERLDPEDLTEPAISGGYLLSIDRQDAVEPPLGGLTFGTPSPVNFIEPNGDDMTNAVRAPQITYIRNYLNNFNATLNNNALWTNPMTGYAAYIDVDSWIDLHIHEVITFNVDAMRLSGYFYKDRNKKLEYGPTWDYDRTQGSTDGRDANPRTWRSTVPDLGTDFFNFTPWWNRLLSAPDFWQAWIDRYQELREGTNVLSTNNIWGHITRLANECAEAHPRELARWGRQPRGANGTGTGTFATETQWRRNWYSNRMDFADTNFLAKPGFNVQPGAFSNTFTVTVTPAVGYGNKPAGTQLLLSPDGTDPRLSGGAIATGPNILSNTGPITVTISNNTRLFARSRNTAHTNLTGANNPPISSPWSGPTVGTYYYPSQTPPLRITEIMYHPPDAPPGNATNDVDNFEYLEFENISGAPLNVTGFRLRGGAHFDFPSLTLAAGQTCVVVSDLNGFLSRYDTNSPPIIVAGSYTNNPGQNRLGNGGDHLVLQGRMREPILDFEYSDGWYPATDGAGFALQIVDENLPTTAWGLKTSWRPSDRRLGTPGVNDGGAVTVIPVVINEILTHTDLPQVDAIELYNPTAGSANIGGWFLTDNFNNPTKYRIADGTSVPANGYLALFSSNSFGSIFDLSSRGEEIYLFSGDGTNVTGYVHGFDFGAQANGVTFGRYVTSSGIQYPAQATPTLGATNSAPKVGPVVISEIMYHPPDISTIEGPRDNDKDEYIELANISSSIAPLYDTNNPANTWRLRDAVSFTFPTNIFLSVGERILVVSFDPLADPLAALRFRNSNAVDSLTRIFGPYQGQLDNSSDAVELVRPDVPQPPGAPDAGAVYYILVDKVNYSHLPPWPELADGTGDSLQRVVPGAFGNDPTNWVAGIKSPGVSETGEGAPVFTMHPQNVAVVGGNSASFSIIATGAPPIAYQWRHNNADIAGATDPTYVIPSVAPSDAGTYRCVARNAGGAVLSSNATLTYIIPPNITAQPANVFIRVPPDPLTVSNRTAVFTVTASSAAPPISYRWRVNGTNIPLDTTNMFGITTNRLVVTNVLFEHTGYYSCLVSDGNGSVPSATAVLGVNPYMLVPPQPLTVTEGADISASVVVQAFPPPFHFSWRRATATNVFYNSTSMTNFGTWNSTAAGYALAGGILSSNFNLRLVFTNLSTPANGAALLNNNSFITVVADSDGDGVPNTLETALGLNPMFSEDGEHDLDGDGMSNADEYRAGTELDNSASYLRIDQSTVPGTAIVYFASVSNRTYTVQYADGLPAATWSRLADVLSQPISRTNTFVDPDWTTNRFYRVATPRVP